MSEIRENKVWNPEDIVNNASNWSLAADKELLRHLQDLSEKILSQAAKTNDNLVALLDDLDKTGLSLDIANIELDSLHHTQFIESRVYEDDDEFEETEDSKVVVEVVDKKSEEQKTKNEIEEGILEAVRAVEQYYEYKEVPNSYSDDEDDSPNFVWQPKDPYLARPLPYVIGTTEWYRKWHVGLLDDSSDDEDVKAARVVTDDIDSQSSDDERHLPPLDRRTTMTLDENHSNHQWRPSDVINIDRHSGLNPIANSTLVPGGSQFTESSDESNSLPVKEPNASFTEQLAQKLGNVAQAQESGKPSMINSKPIKKPATTTSMSLFFDEPPPLNNDDSESSDGEDIFGKPGSSKGLFGRSNAGLFDDSDETQSFWGQSKVGKQDVLKAPEVSKTKADDSEPKAGSPLFDDEPPALPQESKKKKPIGGVSIFGNTDIMKAGSLIKNLRRASSSDSRESTPPELDVASSINKSVESERIVQNKSKDHSKVLEKNASSSINKENVIISKEKISLFDESDSLFEDDLFSNVSTQKFTSNLFDDDSVENTDSSSLFYASNVSTVKKFSHKTDPNSSAQQKSSLFQDSDFKNPANQNKVASDIFDRPEAAKSLFDDLNVVASKRLSLLDDVTVKSDNDGKPTKRTVLFNDDVSSANKIENMRPKPVKRRNLFEDDLVTTFPSAQNTSDLAKSAANRRPNLFDDFDEPPSLFNDDLITEKSLFDNELVNENELIKPNGESEQKELLVKTTVEELNNEPIKTENASTILLPDNAVLECADVPVVNRHPSFNDSPPDLDDDNSDSGSEHNNLFDDIEDDSSEWSLPAPRNSSIFDDEPPLLPGEVVKEPTISETAPVAATSGGETIDSHKPVYRNISVADNYSEALLSRRTLSIHERLNSIEAPVFVAKDMEDSKEILFEGKSEVIEDDEMLKREPITVEIQRKSSGASGKIRHNLNINVAALLPGSSRKAKVAAPEENIAANNLDELDNTTEILQCITKDRAKIPVKRRPSTRKARQESTTNVVTENNNNSKTIAPLKQAVSTEIDKTNQNVVVEETTQNEAEAKQVGEGAVRKKQSSQLFASSDDSEDDIFKSTKALPPKEYNGLKAQSLFDKQPVIKGDVFESPDYKKSRIFFDDDDENVDDYFSSKKLPPKSNIMKKNLFDDEEEGDDLFQSTMFKNEMKPAKILGPAKKAAKSTALFLSADATEDPLDLFK